MPPPTGQGRTATRRKRLRTTGKVQKPEAQKVSQAPTSWEILSGHRTSELEPSTVREGVARILLDRFANLEAPKLSESWGIVERLRLLHREYPDPGIRAIFGAALSSY